MRNTIVAVLGVVLVVALLAGLRGDGTLDVVRSVWSMKPPRLVQVERVLRLDLPPFAEAVEVLDPVEVRVTGIPPAGAPRETDDRIPFDQRRR